MNLLIHHLKKEKQVDRENIERHWEWEPSRSETLFFISLYCRDITVEFTNLYDCLSTMLPHKEDTDPNNQTVGN